ncbi:unnamed protein product, partial [Mesorhabditis spiculigera]
MYLLFQNGIQCDMFQGIPYAQPPVGELRFRKPQPAKRWEGVLKCTRYRNRSLQSDMFWEKLTQSASCSEDCLYLNVFAPAVDGEKTYPVLFYIHGGGFVMDSPARLVPKKLCKQLASKGIVVVTVTYRLGYLGFFSTGDEACQGNMGLYDQAMALRWVKNNVSAFGGNPNDITVAGQSAGAVSTDLLSLSPVTRDLFQKKIVMGGNSFCHWGTTTQAELADYCRKKAEKLGWRPQQDYNSTAEESEDMMRFLRTVPAHKFATTMYGNKIIFSEGRLPLAPVMDEAFLPRPLADLRREAPKMESIVGGGHEESLLFIAIGFLKCNEKDWEHALQMIAKKSANFGQKEVTELAHKLYGDPAKLRGQKSEMAKMYATMISDVVGNYACHRYLRDSQTHDKATFAYSFDYTSKLMYGWLAPMAPGGGGTHASDIIYLLDVNYFSSPLPKDKDDRAMCKMTADYFANFIKTGNPNTEKTAQLWEPVPKKDELRMFSFDLQPKMLPKLYDGRIDKLEAMAVEMKAQRIIEQTTDSILSSARSPLNRSRSIEILDDKPVLIPAKKRAQSSHRYLRNNSVVPVTEEIQVTA